MSRDILDRGPLRGYPVEVRSIVLMAQNHICPHCSDTLTDRNWRGDHIVPYSDGGPTKMANIQILCFDCNAKKSNRAPDEEIKRDLAAAAVRLARIIELAATGGNPPGSVGVLGGEWANPGDGHHVTRWAFDREPRGGIPAPQRGTVCHMAWQVMDRATIGRVVPFLADVLAKGKHLNEGNIRTEFSRWKRFNGFSPAKPISISALL